MWHMVRRRDLEMSYVDEIYALAKLQEKDGFEVTKESGWQYSFKYPRCRPQTRAQNKLGYYSRIKINSTWNFTHSLHTVVEGNTIGGTQTSGNCYWTMPFIQLLHFSEIFVKWCDFCLRHSKFCVYADLLYILCI